MNNRNRSQKTKSGNKKGDTVTLQTVIGQRVWRGREAGDGKAFIMGADGFLKRARNMEQAMSDDPWAEQTYAKILEAIEVVRDEYDEILDEINAAFPEQGDAISYDMPELDGVLNPEQFAIHYRSTVGWKFIALMVQADDLIVDLITAERLGVKTVKRRGEQTARIQSRARHVMSQIMKWKYTGVTHQDVAENNEKAQAAIRKLGPLNAGQQAEEFPAQPTNRDEVQSSPGLFKRLFSNFKKS